MRTPTQASAEKERERLSCYLRTAQHRGTYNKSIQDMLPRAGILCAVAHARAGGDVRASTGEEGKVVSCVHG